MNTQEYKDKLSTIKNEISKENFSGEFNDFYINSNEDLSLSLHGGIFQWEAEYNGDNYNLSIEINDEYNFELNNYNDIKIGLVNNHAVLEEVFGIIQNYDINISIEDKLTL
jgi:galactose-1-phosphate uridylyltransferase